MSNEINQYLLECFKRVFKKEIEKSVDIDFEALIKIVCFENSLQEIPNHDEILLWFDQVYHMSYLDGLIDTKGLQEIIIHSIKNVDVISRFGKEKLDVSFLSLEDFKLSLQILTMRAEQNWNYKSPFASFLYRFGGHDFRVTIVHDSITQYKSPKVFLRKISTEQIPLSKFNIDKEIEDELLSYVKNHNNIIVAGSTASGKTTFLKSLIHCIDSKEHIVAIEDTHELSGPESTFSHLISSPEEGKSMTDFCKYALRMSPDRIILGEIRAEEVIPFILAMNTGHKGLMGTIHANSARDTLLRMAMLFCTFSSSANAISYNQVLKLICENIEFVVHLEKKEINEIIKVIGCEDGSPIYQTIYRKDNPQQQQHNHISLAS